MPNVDGEKFPYTVEGKKRAFAAAKAKKKMPGNMDKKMPGNMDKKMPSMGPKSKKSGY
jgi:hypothetical protein